MTLPNVALVSGRSGVDVAASLPGPAATAVASMPSVVAEQATVTTPSQEQPDVAVAASEGVAQSVPRWPK